MWYYFFSHLGINRGMKSVSKASGVNEYNVVVGNDYI